MAIAGGTPLTLDFDAAEQDWTARRLLFAGPVAGVLYRVEAVSYSYVVDADREEYGSTDPRLELFGFIVAKWTPHGATLAHAWSGARRRWVDLRPGAKQWASRTARDAVEQFAKRRRAQLYILARQTLRAEYDLQLAERLLLDFDGEG